MKTRFDLLSTPAFFVLLSLLLSTSACFTPQPVIRINPVSEEVTWNYGQAFARDRADDLDCEAAFAYHDRDHLVFDVEVVNRGEKPMLVTPEAFYIRAENGAKRMAVDPEKELLDRDIRTSRQEANVKNALVATGVLAVAATVAAVAAGGDNNNDNNSLNSLDETLAIDLAPTIAIGVNAAVAPPLPPDPALAPTPVERWFWSDYTLRRTTAGPNEAVNGKVLFPRLDAMGRFLLLLPVGEQVCSFEFQQTVYKP